VEHGHGRAGLYRRFRSGGKGLLNLTQVTPTNAAKTWATSTADEIRASINAGLSAAWANSAYSMVPTDLLIPPEQFSAGKHHRIQRW
jgi:hypothetical protein